MRAMVLMKLGMELFRQGRLDEGVTRLAEAADVFLASGEKTTAYEALMTLAGLCREHDMPVSGPMFTRAHDVGLTLFSTPDAGHYAALKKRVATIDADIRERFGTKHVDELLPSARHWIKESSRLIRAGHYADADLRLRSAGELLVSIDAHYELGRVLFLQGPLSHNRGDDRLAGDIYDRAATLAAALGHAAGESTYLLYRS